MSFANVSDILATTIESRSRKIADNVTNNNALLKKLDMGGRVKTFSGGHKIYQEISFAENANGGYYSGYDLLPVGASDVISAAEFDIKQIAVPCVISGLEQLQNAGKERMIDLLESRMQVAESTMTNIVNSGLYSDGTGSGGKEIDGLDVAVPTAPTTGTYGGIDRSAWAFWQSKYTAAASDATTVQANWNAMWGSLVRGADRPDLIMVDANMWADYLASLQVIQRFSGTETGQLGFPTLKYMDADVCLDGGIQFPSATSGGTAATTKTAYFLNTKYLHFRPHSARNMVPLSPNRRYSTNQDAEVQIMAWAGNLTSSGSAFQGRFVDSS